MTRPKSVAGSDLEWTEGTACSEDSLDGQVPADKAYLVSVAEYPALHQAPVSGPSGS